MGATASSLDIQEADVAVEQLIVAPPPPVQRQQPRDRNETDGNFASGVDDDMVERPPDDNAHQSLNENKSRIWSKDRDFLKVKEKEFMKLYDADTHLHIDVEQPQNASSRLVTVGTGKACEATTPNTNAPSPLDDSATIVQRDVVSRLDQGRN
jgi:hypothetical protein